MKKIQFWKRRLVAAAVAVVIANVAHAERLPNEWCVVAEEEPSFSAVAEREQEDDIAPKIPTVRAPFAEEVGPPPRVKGQTESIAPLTGLPLETSFDNVAWIPEGLAPGKNGDLNIVPDHPTSGCVTALAPHPSNQNILYIGTANGGVWRTDNALATSVYWRPLTDDQLSLSIGGLAMDANDATGNTLVAGIGRRSSYSSLGGAHKGLLKTTDGGATWTRLGETALAGRSIYNLAVRGNTMLLAVPSTDNATARGLYRTVDGGASFTNMSGLGGSNLPVGAVTHLAADPSNVARFYVHVASVGIYRSDDSGATWINAGAGVANVAQLALTVAFDGTVFAAELTGTSRVYRSTTQGASWVQMDSVQANTGGLFNGFVADPADSNLVYLSGLFVRTSFPFSGRVVRGNAALAPGSQWTAISSTGVQGTGTAPHTDSRALAFTAGNRLIEADDGGIYELPIANTGSEGTTSQWRSLVGNLQNSELHSMAYDPLARIVIAGSQDLGFLEQIASGTLPWNKTSNGDGGDAAVDLLTTPGQSIRYGSSQNLSGFYRFTYDANNNRLATAFPALTLVGGGVALVGNAPFVAPIAMNAVAGGRLMFSGNARVYETTDQGATVTQIDTVAANQLSRIAYGGRLGGVANPDVLFYGNFSSIRYRTTAGGAFASVAFPGGTVQGIVFDPQNWQNEFLVGTSTVYSATNAGSFVNLTGNLTGVGTFHTIEYLTLPSGNALAVGTDLGVYFMRLSNPGVWTTLGDNLPHAPTFISSYDPSGQVLVVSTLGRGAWLYDFKQTKATAQYGETFQAYADGTTVLDSRTGELFSSQFGTATKVADNNLRELQLTADGNSFARGVLRLPDLNPGRAVGAFSAKWNATIYGDSASLADGFSFNFGPLGAITATAFTDSSYATEDGFNAGLTVSVRTFNGNAPGYYVRVNGSQVAGGFVSKPTANWGSFNPARHFFEIDWRNDTGLTLRVDGVAIFTNLATPGFTPAMGDRFVFGARTSGFDEQVALDNIALFTGGVLAPISPGAPYYFSSENPPTNETADKAFDGNANTKWLANNYTGHIGATITAGKSVRLYTLTSASDIPGRDLALWDFQTSTDGIRWTQHGIQGEQFFANRLEPRAFVVSNPTTDSRFRVLITQNHDAPEIQLAEFQPWEFIPVAQKISVTNTNDAGAASLRQALTAAAAYDPAATITFAPALAGQTIALASEIVVAGPTPVMIDGSALTAGLTIDGGPGTNRIFTVNSGANLTLAGLTLSGGNGGSATFDGNAGAILNLGTLSMNRCTVTGNTANLNNSVVGGAIQNNGTFALTQSTLTANSTAGYGGALANYGSATITHSTFSGNSAANNGGAIDNGNGTTIVLALNNSIVAGNSAAFGADINNFNGIVTRAGANIVQGYAGVPATGSGTISSANPLLAPLDNYGGLTRTLALQIGSPARNAAAVLAPALTSDQRGFAIIGTPDIGAYEAGTFANFNAYIWETLPVSATIAQHATTFDFDGDGLDNFSEWLADTDASNALSIFRLTQVIRSGGNLAITFPTSVRRTYAIESSPNLINWTSLLSVPGTGNPITVNVSASPPLFLRARTGP